jgi:hypothetical protein
MRSSWYDPRRSEVSALLLQLTCCMLLGAEYNPADKTCRAEAGLQQKLAAPMAQSYAGTISIWFKWATLPANSVYSANYMPLLMLRSKSSPPTAIHSCCLPTAVSNDGHSASLHLLRRLQMCALLLEITSAMSCTAAMPCVHHMPPNALYYLRSAAQAAAHVRSSVPRLGLALAWLPYWIPAEHATAPRSQRANCKLTEPPPAGLADPFSYLSIKLGNGTRGSWASAALVLELGTYKGAPYQYILPGAPALLQDGRWHNLHLKQTGSLPGLGHLYIDAVPQPTKQVASSAGGGSVPAISGWLASMGSALDSVALGGWVDLTGTWHSSRGLSVWQLAVRPVAIPFCEVVGEYFGTRALLQEAMPDPSVHTWASAVAWIAAGSYTADAVRVVLSGRQQAASASGGGSVVVSELAAYSDYPGGMAMEAYTCSGSWVAGAVAYKVPADLPSSCAAWGGPRPGLAFVCPPSVNSTQLALEAAAAAAERKERQLQRKRDRQKQVSRPASGLV